MALGVAMAGLFVAGIAGGTISGSLGAAKQQCQIYEQAQQVEKQTKKYASNMKETFNNTEAMCNLEADKVTGEVLKIGTAINQLNEDKDNFKKAFLSLQIWMALGIILIGTLLLMKKWGIIK